MEALGAPREAAAEAVIPGAPREAEVVPLGARLEAVELEETGALPRPEAVIRQTGGGPVRASAKK
jgi:hypothetical protein